MGCLRYNVTHIVLDVQELERDSVDVTAVNGMAYRVASNGRCVEHSTQSTVTAAMRESAWRGGVPRVWAGGGAPRPPCIRKHRVSKPPAKKALIVKGHSSRRTSTVVI